MMKKTLRYELALLKKRKVELLLFLLLFLLLLFLFACMPFLSDQIFSFHKPRPEERPLILASYQSSLDNIQERIKEGYLTYAGEEEEIKRYEYFLSTGTVEGEYLALSSLYLRSSSGALYSYGLSLLEGASFLTLLFAPSLPFFFFSLPVQKGYARLEKLSGAKRRDIFLSKSIFVSLFLLFYLILVFLFSFLLLRESFDESALFYFRGEYISVSLKEIFFSKLLALFLSEVFFSLLGEVIFFLFRHPSFTLFFPAFFFFVFFLFTCINVPHWGNYGDPSGVQYFLLYFLPCSDIVLVPTFGFRMENIFLYLIYAFLDSGLFFFARHRFERIPL